MNMVNQISLMMPKPQLLLILVSITSLLIVEQATAQPPTEPLYFNEVCVTTAENYTANSTYESSLRTVLSDLQEHGTSEIFYNMSAGNGSNTVYGQYFCRGDINSTLCGACIEQAAQSLFANCSLVRGGIMWYEQCTVRYSNESMVGIEAEYPRAWYNATSNVADPDTLASVLNSTVNKLITDATGGSTPSLFSTGEGAVSAFETLYCLVQCSPDLSAEQCDTCLRATYAFIPTCCVGMSKQVAIFFASCQLRYTTYGAFYSGATTPALPPSTTSPPPPGLLGSGTPVSDSGSAPPATNTSSTKGTSGASVALRRTGVGIMMTGLISLLMLIATS